MEDAPLLTRPQAKRRKEMLLVPLRTIMQIKKKKRKKGTTNSRRGGWTRGKKKEEKRLGVLTASGLGRRRKGEQNHQNRTRAAHLRASQRQREF